MRPSSSLVTTASSNSLVKYIQEKRARDQEARTKQEEFQKNILNFLGSKGYGDTLTYGGGSSSS